jgi:hypothetical protein
LDLTEYDQYLCTTYVDDYIYNQQIHSYAPSDLRVGGVLANFIVEFGLCVWMCVCLLVGV